MTPWNAQDLLDAEKRTTKAHIEALTAESDDIVAGTADGNPDDEHDPRDRRSRSSRARVSASLEQEQAYPHRTRTCRKANRRWHLRNSCRMHCGAAHPGRAPGGAACRLYLRAVPTSPGFVTQPDVTKKSPQPHLRVQCRVSQTGQDCYGPRVAGRAEPVALPSGGAVRDADAVRHIRPARLRPHARRLDAVKARPRSSHDDAARLRDVP